MKPSLHGLIVRDHAARSRSTAKARFTAALARRSNYARAEHGLALIALENREWDEAERHLRGAQQLDPFDPLPKLTLEKLARERAREASSPVK